MYLSSNIKCKEPGKLLAMSLKYMYVTEESLI